MRFSEQVTISSAPNSSTLVATAQRPRLTGVPLSSRRRTCATRTMAATTEDALLILESVDVEKLREKMQSQMSTFGYTHKQLVAQHIHAAWDATTGKWSRIKVQLDGVVTVHLCITSWALVHGFTSSTLQSVAYDIQSGDFVENPQFYFTSSRESSEKQINRNRSMEYMLLREYVRELVYKHEVNPAPGAACRAAGETYITKRSWKQKWEDCKAYFHAKAARVPGSSDMLKRAWKQEIRLKERVSKSHSKCDTCSTIDAQLYSLRGKKTQAAKEEFANLQRARREHEESHLRDRAVLDTAGYRAILEPSNIWTILLDAATERTMTLPRLKRRAKLFGTRPFFKQKLMAAYAYGYGFVPYLVHESQKFGANLTFTVLWLTLTRMYKDRKRWPQELHITIDNTSGENKNTAMLAFCSWLVQSGKVKRVRVFFLKVGHTHVIIDQIFGVITVALRGKEVLTPADVHRIIDQTGQENFHWNAHPVTRLESLFDIDHWVKTTMDMQAVTRECRAQDVDQQGQYKGMYDFIFRTHSEWGVSLQYREDVAFPLRPYHAPSGCQTIRKKPTAGPPLAKMKSKEQWGQVDNHSINDTIVMVAQHATELTPAERVTFLETWSSFLNDIPSCTELLRPSQKLEFEFFDTTADLAELQEAAEQNQNLNDEPNDPETVYREYKRRVLNIRDEPLAIDPVISSEQTPAQFERAKAAMRAAIREGRGPTVSKQSPVLDGDLLLASEPDSAGVVSLYKVEGLGIGHTPYTTDLLMTCVQYEHTPKQNVKGLHGTFEVAKLNGKQVKKLLQRQWVVVFNVELVSKTKALTLESLRALALALPETYPMLDLQNIGEEHLEEDDAEEEEPQERRRGPSRHARPQQSAREDDEEEGAEEDEEEDCSDEDGEQNEGAEHSFLDEDLTGKLVFIRVNEIARICPALVIEDDRGSQITVRWYAASPKWQTRNGRPPRNAPRVEYTKFWTHSNWLSLEKIPRKQQRPHLLPRDLVEKYWCKQVLERSTVLDIEFPDTPEQDMLWRSDTVSISYDFYEAKLLPVIIMDGASS